MTGRHPELTADTSHLTIGIDIGGTKVAGALVDDSGRLSSSGRQPGSGVPSLPSRARDGAEAVLGVVSDLVGRLLDAADAPVRGVGVGSAGVIDHAGVVRSATDLITAWAGTDIPARLAHLGVPVAVLNDVHAFGYGEAWTGAARAHRSVLAVAVGTGIGGALLEAGRLVVGRTGSAGAVGHVPSHQAVSRRCSCGLDGHLEAVASGPAIELEYRQRSGHRLGLPEIGRRAAAGEAQAREAITLGAIALGEALGGLVNVLDPDVVVLGGGVMALGEDYLLQVREATRGSALPGPAQVPVLAGELGGHAAVVGAARWLNETHPLDAPDRVPRGRP